MRLVDLSTRRPVTVFIFTVAAVIFGVVGFRQLATDLLPDITYPSLTVRTAYPGAAPVEVESLVSRPVENAIGVVNNLLRVTSSSRAEVSEVTLEFAWGTNMDFAALDVRERLDVLLLPDDTEPPVLLRYDPALDPILRIGLKGDSDLMRLRRVAEDRVKRSLERVDGVAAAVVQGGLEEEIQVEIDERRLASLGLTVSQLAQRLAQENVNLTGGRLKDGQTEYLVRTVNELLRPEDLEDLIIGDGRGSVRLEDVATVRRGFKEREIITRLDGQETVEVAVYKAGGTNTVTVSGAVKNALGRVRADLEKVDPSLEVTVITDQARYIRQAVQEVLSTAVQGGVLAILVLFFFLRSWRATVIIGTAIPVSVVATFFLMYLMDISLNIMSLGGLTLGIGLLVDNAIVVLESIQRKRDEGLSEDEASRIGAGSVAGAIVASTLTSICVFLPIVFVEGVAAQFFSDQALTVTFSLLVSLVVALTLIPMLASRRLPEAEEGDDEKAGGIVFRATVAVVRAIKGLFKLLFLPFRLLTIPAGWFNDAFERFTRLYRRVLATALARPALTLLVALAATAGSLLLYPRIGQELVPELVQGEFYLEVELEPGTNLEVTQRRMSRLEERVAALDGVQEVYAVVGSSGQQGGIAGENRENLARLTVTVEAPVSREKEDALMEEVRRVAAGTGGPQAGDMELLFSRPTYFSFKTPVEVELRGYNLKLLRRYAEAAREGLAAIRGLTDVESSAEGGAPELQIRFDRERLASLGLSLEEVASVVEAKVEGTVATEVQQEDRTIDIRLRAAETYRNSAAALRNLVVVQQGRTTLPLSAVAQVTEAEGPAEIRRADGERTALLTANLVDRDLGSAAEEIAQVMEGLDLPAGFDWRLSGQQQEMETSFGSLRLALFLAIFLVYLVMASQFESLLHPFVILFSVPLSVVGVLVTLYLVDVRISVVVLIGVVMLAGIVVNNAILLVDAANRLRQEGLTKLAALEEAGAQRLRPILMTTATTVLGLAPMALGLGEGAELRSPMALAVIGGLLSSTALTLVVVPVIYRILDRGE